jgi:hypothetical protein
MIDNRADSEGTDPVNTAACPLPNRANAPLFAFHGKIVWKQLLLFRGFWAIIRLRASPHIRTSAIVYDNKGNYKHHEFNNNLNSDNILNKQKEIQAKENDDILTRNRQIIFTRKYQAHACVKF